MNARGRKLIRIVSVEEIEEGEERPIARPACGEPVKELPTDDGPFLSSFPEESAKPVGGRFQERNA